MLSGVGLSHNFAKSTALAEVCALLSVSVTLWYIIFVVVDMCRGQGVERLDAAVGYSGHGV